MTWDSSLETLFYGQILCNAQGQQPSYHYTYVLPLKAPNKTCSRRHFNFLILSFEENKA